MTTRRLFVLGWLAIASAAAACSGFTADPVPATTNDGGVPEAAIVADGPSAAPPDTGPSSGDPVVEISGGYYLSCARTQSGKVYCWGEDLYGSIGSDAGDEVCLNNGSLHCRYTPVFVDGLTDAVQISVGLRQACAVRENHTIVCWGQNAFNELGLAGADAIPHYTPTTVPDIATAREVSTGQYNSCAVVETNTGGTTVECWGLDTEAVTGRPPPELDGGAPSSRPTVVVGLEDALHVKLGIAYLGCASFTGGSLKCWGVNYASLMGTSGTFDPCGAGSCTPTPIPITGLTVSDFAVGGGTVCGISLAHTVECVGYNGYGQLGMNSSDSNMHPTPNQVPLQNVTQITGRFQHICAMSDGKPYCWGANIDGAFGSLDAGDTAPCNVIFDYRCLRAPTPLVGVDDVASVWAGANTTFVIQSNGTVLAAGSNGFGQLGRERSNDDATLGDASCQLETMCSPEFAPVVLP